MEAKKLSPSQWMTDRMGDALLYKLTLYFSGIDYGNAGKALEVVDVESQDMINFEDEHGGNEFGIMHLGAIHRVRDDEPPPLAVRLYRIGQDSEKSLDPRGEPICRGNGIAETISIERASAYVPEFTDILRRYAKFMALRIETFENCARCAIQRMRALN